MRFKNRSRFSSYLLDRVVTHDMSFKERMNAAILVGLYCSKLPEGTPITVTE